MQNSEIKDAPAELPESMEFINTEDIRMEYYLPPKELAVFARLIAQMQGAVAMICSQYDLQGTWTYQGGNKLVRQG